MSNVKHADFKGNNWSLSLTRIGRFIYEYTDKAAIEHEYPTVSAAKRAMENARISGRIN